MDRLAPLLAPERLWILTNDHLRDEIVRQLPEVPARQILAEPVQRNTAPAIGLAAHILHSIDPDAVMGVFPSDHVIGKPGRFRQLVRAALRAAEKGQIAVLGIRPRWAETGFGYIEFPRGVKPGALEAVPVLRFREKPDAANARRYAAAGRFYWNAGMFFWRAGVLLEEMRRHLPETAALLDGLPAFGQRQFAARLKESFPKMEKISIDYAVLERAAGVVGIACDEIGWSDLGSWTAIHDLLPRDGEGNTLSRHVLAEASRGDSCGRPGKFVALLGVEDLIVVDTPDALLVARRDRAQEVGRIVDLLEAGDRQELT